MQRDPRAETWMAAAVARHAHEPDQKRRDRLIRQTFKQIEREAELAALRLPDVPTVTRNALMDEATATVLDHLGWDAPDTLADPEIDTLFERLELAARIQLAPAKTRAKWYARRLYARVCPGTEAERRALDQVAALIAEQSDHEDRNMGCRMAEWSALQLRLGVD